MMRYRRESAVINKKQFHPLTDVPVNDRFLYRRAFDDSVDSLELRIGMPANLYLSIQVSNKLKKCSFASWIRRLALTLASDAPELALSTPAHWPAVTAGPRACLAVVKSSAEFESASVIIFTES